MNAPDATPRPLPLAGLRVVEFTHMVMGPTCGMVLADMGAEVIKVEPIEGDRTRHLLGAGAGFFPMFNRNKKSIAIDLHKPEGAAVARKLAASADVVAENFKPGTMGKYGLDYAALSAVRSSASSMSATRAFCPARTSTAWRWTRWCR
jgi:crotonobetainyl-CoA:carnitine CoA-transferase CaiB-like acyl-CoA transferase